MTPLRLAPAARRDLSAIWTYTAQAWGVDQADSYITTIRRDMLRLCDFPKLGTAHSSRHGDFRKLPSGHHLVFYLVRNTHIEVVRVLHERMDVNAHLRN